MHLVEDQKNKTYPSWALATFQDSIAPVLESLCADSLMMSEWIDSCCPGNSEVNRFRLFPGCLYLLWVQALSEVLTEEHIRIAAALECLHNASLHHDDALDQHDSRRGINTIRAVAGTSGSILAGDGLVGAALGLLASIKRLDSPKHMAVIGNAWSRMNYGQLMDEPYFWKTVNIDNYAEHWKRMTRNKLALGNAGAPLAAVSTCQYELAKTLNNIHEDFSLVSQILNDVGDLEGWAGFHVIGPCKRERSHEAQQKPSIATIWIDELASRDYTNKKDRIALLERAHGAILDLSKSALRMFEKIKVCDDTEEIFLDFFSRPLKEFDRMVSWSQK